MECADVSRLRTFGAIDSFGIADEIENSKIQIEFVDLKYGTERMHFSFAPILYGNLSLMILDKQPKS